MGSDKGVLSPSTSNLRKFYRLKRITSGQDLTLTLIQHGLVGHFHPGYEGQSPN